MPLDRCGKDSADRNGVLALLCGYLAALAGETYNLTHVR